MSRRFQFSLRPIFWLTALVGVLCVVGPPVFNSCRSIDPWLVGLPVFCGMSGACLGAPIGATFGRLKAGSALGLLAGFMCWLALLFLPLD